jgi:hypothetical protein
MRGLVWWFYADRKAYRLDPTRRRRRELRTRFDRIFRRRTGFATLDRLLKRLHANKAELLMVLAPRSQNGRGGRSRHLRGSSAPRGRAASIRATASPGRQSLAVIPWHRRCCPKASQADVARAHSLFAWIITRDLREYLPPWSPIFPPRHTSWWVIS